MIVYIKGAMLAEDYAYLVAAEVVNVRADSLDLRLEDGSQVIAWRAAVYDKDENEIRFETIKRDFVAADIAALRTRIEALEALMTEV